MSKAGGEVTHRGSQHLVIVVRCEIHRCHPTWTLDANVIDE
jgi:hypothetical protein